MNIHLKMKLERHRTKVNSLGEEGNLSRQISSIFFQVKELRLREDTTPNIK
jgi:hypothetical protein